MGFLSNLFGGMKSDSARRKATAGLELQEKYPAIWKACCGVETCASFLFLRQAEPNRLRSSKHRPMPRPAMKCTTELAAQSDLKSLFGEAHLGE